MKRNIGLLVLVLALSSTAFALAGDSKVAAKDCDSACCVPCPGACPVPCEAD